MARALEAPLDVVPVRKLGVPVQPELAMGAIGEDGARVIDERVLQAARLSMADVDVAETRERRILERRMQQVRLVAPMVALDGCTAIVIDDGIATGSTARAACGVVRARGASLVVVAVPIAPPSALPTLREVADDVIAVETPETFHAVGQWYGDFTPVSDDLMLSLLERARRGV